MRATFLKDDLKTIMGGPFEFFCCLNDIVLCLFIDDNVLVNIVADLLAV
jgi:hypothetical protein